MKKRSSTLQMVGFTVVLLFAVGLLLTGLGVFGVPSVNDFRDWDKYYDKHEALQAEYYKLNAEFDKLSAEVDSIIPSELDAMRSMFNDPAKVAEVKARMAKLKAWQKKWISGSENLINWIDNTRLNLFQNTQATPDMIVGDRWI